jgi:hypothetical protein
MKRFVLAASAAIAVGLAPPLFATFHLMEISELLVGAGGDCRVQYLELRMTAAGQRFVSGQALFFFDAAGNQVGMFMIPMNVTNSNLGENILFGTAEVEAYFGVAPDFILPRGLLMPHGGRVSFAGASAAASVDSLAYGIYTGQNGSHGAPAAALSVTANQSLTRTVSSAINSLAFALLAPSPRNNARQSGTLSVPEPSCFLTDDFADLANWDQPTENMGLALQTCLGAPVNADIGFVTASDNKLLFRPGLQDQLNLGAPIAFTGLKTKAASSFAAEPSYRARFNMRAQPGVVIAAVFTHQHYTFDDGDALLDPITASGMGMNFSFDSVTETSDHAHPDVRLACLAEGSAEGPRDADFDGFLLTSNTDYTVILDAQGDDEVGPLTLAAKLFPASEEEPDQPLATWKLPGGLGAPPDEEFDHGVLIAALGSNTAALEVTDFSVCDIPRHRLPVRCLTCVRNLDQSVTLTWQNPIGGDEAPIAIVLNGVELDRIDGTDTTFTVQSPPEEDLSFQVINFSCTPAECSVCFNADPVPLIEAPANVPFDEGMGAVVLDSSASNDGDDGTQTLTRVWSVVGRPAGSVASITLLDPDGLEVDLAVDQHGLYTVELSLTDSGCIGDFSDVRTSTAVHDVRFSLGGTRLRRGDADPNGNLELTDAIRILNFLFLGIGGALACPDAADSDDNGTIELTDAVRILGFLFLGLQPPAPPGPMLCGLDATVDGLGACVYLTCP